jgi:hypothetical protein
MRIGREISPVSRRFKIPPGFDEILWNTFSVAIGGGGHEIHPSACSEYERISEMKQSVFIALPPHVGSTAPLQFNSPPRRVSFAQKGITDLSTREPCVAKMLILRYPT